MRTMQIAELMQVINKINWDNDPTRQADNGGPVLAVAPHSAGRRLDHRHGVVDLSLVSQNARSVAVRQKVQPYDGYLLLPLLAPLKGRGSI